MNILFYTLFFITTLTTLLPFIPLKHWIFRVPEFLKIQLLTLQLITLIIGLFYWHNWSGMWFYISIGIILLLIIHHLIDLFPFTKAYGWIKPAKKTNQKMSEPIKIISSNVYQFNTSYKKLIDLINKEQPDVVLTMESNKDWEKALRAIEEDYPYHVKQTLENTYGMHFYSKLEILEQKIHFFINDETPCFEIKLKTKDGYTFDFYGVHPPPPSPTEEENSKERDGELMQLSKKINALEDKYCIVVGDFNNVAWADSTKRFRRLTGLIDPRFGRGFVCTFNAKYPFLRMPIDLMYHSESIYVETIKHLPSINSDHFPLCCIFRLAATKVEESTEEKENGDESQREEDIQEGKEQAEES